VKAAAFLVDWFSIDEDQFGLGFSVLFDHGNELPFFV